MPRCRSKVNQRMSTTKPEFAMPFSLTLTIYIRAATHNFSHELVIGKGGFGNVFKGVIDNGATKVTIKRLDPMSKQGGKEFSTEIEMLFKFQHSHVVSLIGYCDNKDEMILVYEYMENGRLADHLYKERTYDYREVVGSSGLHSDNVYTDSPTTLVPLSHSPPTGPIEGIKKPTLGEDTMREDTPGGSASETLSKIKRNMTCEEQINDNILVSEVASLLEVAPALQEKKDYSVLDEDVCDFGQNFDNREMEGSSTVLLDTAYTDS
ncbi:hypothetical protein LguiA_002279 [Lonicera macranthoides]